MKFAILGHLFLIFGGLVSCSTANFYGDIDLGSNFYYAVAEYNEICLSMSPGAPMDKAAPIITGVDSVGYNDKFILIISVADSTKKFWLIDKTQKTLELNKEDKACERQGQNELSNVSSFKDSTTFAEFKLKQKITLFSSIYYRHKAGYD